MEGISELKKLSKETEIEETIEKLEIHAPAIPQIKWLKWIDSISEFTGLIGGILLPLATTFITYEVLMRFIFKSPSIWVIEISTYLVMISTLFCIAYALKLDYHIRVDFFTNMIPKRSKLILDIVTGLICLVFCFYLVREGSKLVIDAFNLKESTATILRLPRFILLGFIPFGGLLFGLQYVHNILGTFKAMIHIKEETDNKATLIGFLVSGIFIALVIASIVSLRESSGLTTIILFFAFLFSGMPVSLALAIFGLSCFIFFFQSPLILSQIALVTYGTLDSEILSSVPYFILCGIVMINGKVSARIFEFAYVWVKQYRGGLAIASMIFCAIFSAISGSSVATAATISLLALPEMLSRGYEKKFTLGLLAAGGTLGILIPPSIPMMIYGAMTDESISQLFMAGMIPGIILTAMFILYVLLRGKVGKGLPAGEPKESFRKRINTSKSAVLAIMTPVIILGGIYSGIFTPTEAAAVAVSYGLIISLFFYKSFPRSVWKKTILEAGRTAAMLMLLVVGANIAGQAITMTQLSQRGLEWILSFQLNPWHIIICINVFLILLGAPLEAISILVITLPFLHPLIVSLGFSPIWFAVIMVVNMEMALISPPEGMNLFILQSIGKATTGEVSKGVLPFLAIMGLFLILIVCFPSLSTWLPGLFFSR